MRPNQGKSGDDEEQVKVRKILRQGEAAAVGRSGAHQGQAVADVAVADLSRGALGVVRAEEVEV